MSRLDGAIRISPGQDIQAIVDAHRPGTTYLLGDGTYFGQSVEPKSGDTFMAEHIGRAILDGNASVKYAFRSKAARVTIRGFVIQNYHTHLQKGAIQVDGPDWLIEDNEIRRNAAAGVNGTTRTRFRRNYVHHNGQIGVKSRGPDGVFECNEIAYNNCAWRGLTTRECPWPGSSPGWEAGGSKFWHTDHLVVRRNYVHDNGGPGLWTDGDNVHTLYENNVVVGNEGMGIFHEISAAAEIRNNDVRDNGYDKWLYGSQILISTSHDVEVHDNTVVAGPGQNGIAGIHQNRKKPRRALRNLYVHDNLIVAHSRKGTSGISKDTNWNGGAYTCTSNGNRFDSDTYRGGDFALCGDKDWAGFQAAGQEAHGSYTAIVTDPPPIVIPPVGPGAACPD